MADLADEDSAGEADSAVVDSAVAAVGPAAEDWVEEGLAVAEAQAEADSAMVAVADWAETGSEESD